MPRNKPEQLSAEQKEQIEKYGLAAIEQCAKAHSAQSLIYKCAAFVGGQRHTFEHEKFNQMSKDPAEAMSALVGVVQDRIFELDAAKIVWRIKPELSYSKGWYCTYCRLSFIPRCYVDDNAEIVTEPDEVEA